MKEVALLGTSHDIQRGSRLVEEFKLLILNELNSRDYLLVAEEISDYQEYPIVKEICDEKKVKHLIAEPNKKEKLLLGIEEETEVTKRTFMIHYEIIEENGGWPSNPSKENLPEIAWLAYSKDIERLYRAREGEWFKRLDAMNAWPSLFICGASHFLHFKKLLEGNGIKVNVVCDHWDHENK